jgi:hypothetical protein
MSGSPAIALAPRTARVLPGISIVGPVAKVRRGYLGAMLRAAREVGDVTRINPGSPGKRATFYSVCP